MAIKHDFTHEERQKNGRKGGVASGVAKRKRARINEELMLLLSGCADSSGQSEQQKALVAMIEKAKSGDIQAMRLIVDILGEKAKDEQTITHNLAGVSRLDELTSAAISAVQNSDN